MKCPNCDFIDKDEAFGDPATCPKCGAIYEKALRVRELREKLDMQRRPSAQPTEPKKPAPLQAAVTPHNEPSGSIHVKVTDIDMPFWSMVQLLVKWALASIPALLILLLIFVGFTSIFGILFR